MARPTLLSDRPRSSEPADSAAPAAAPSSDLAEWLTRDLRPKGAPSERPRAERPSQPQAVVITESAEPALASWLLQDLKPRHGSVPPEALSAALVASKWESVVPPPDSLVPHAVSEAPPGLAPNDAALDEEDLAVLPSRRRKKRDWRKVVVLAALLSVVGALFWVASGPQAEQLAEAAAVAAPAVVTAPLPPPPPADVDVDVSEPPAEEEASTPAAAATGAAVSAGPEPEPELEELPGRRGRRAGDAVARFADLPSPTLSRLAREKQQRQRKAAGSLSTEQPPPAATVEP